MSNELPSIVNIQEFLAKASLYALHRCTKIDSSKPALLWKSSFTVDLYCPDCKRESTFSSIANNDSLVSILPPGQTPHVFGRELSCARQNAHRIWFFFKNVYGCIMKIGQSPSVADLNENEVSKYKKVLSDNDYRELKKAIGLVAHGIGIGSFVYLRRIFETLIDEAHEKSQQQQNWDKDAFLKARMAEKIKLVAINLPSFLVDNAAVYSILSKGIHDLTDEECLAHFPIVLNAIELILDEKISEQNRLEKVRFTQKSIEDLHANLKNQQE